MVKERNCRVSLRSVALISRLLIDNEATLIFIESQTAYQNLEEKLSIGNSYGFNQGDSGYGIVKV